MKALVKTASGVQCMELPVPALSGPQQVLIRVLRAAICRTDLFAARGILPVADGRVLGHEFTGVIEAMGVGVTRFAVGERVVVNPLLACGHCAECAAKKPHQCAHADFLGIHADGAFAQFIVVDEAQVFPLVDWVGDTIGAYAEPLAATMAILDADLPPDGKIAVTGVGRIAELTHFILEDHGYDVTLTSEGEFDAVVETDLCTANAEATLLMIKPGGLLVLKSRRPAAVALPPLLCITRRLRMQAVYYAKFEWALCYLGQLAHRLDGFIGSEWTLEAHEQAFAAACLDDALKIYFKPND
ncbi:zinc-dependent alcohol dehydrogenase [Propionivibrio sp.]|uniref:zinc-dependent alcohol dehydrogenase n=1 Tax=Propionivibrio sp. TaxID=2212460 RepID=UPI003BF0AD1D